jgi:hypothetical protein
MLQKCILQLCGLVASMSVATVALGQYAPYNPFNNISGYAGGALQKYFQQTTNSSNAPPQSYLNQMALKNAQSLMMQSMSPPRSSFGAARIGLGAGTSFSGSKPFSNYSPGPTVSPYLNLFRVDLNGNQNFNYSTLVEPQLRQQQLNQQQERQNLQTSRRLQAISAQADYSIQGSKEEYPTGHQTVYMYYGHYYQMARPQGKKR